MLPTQSTWGVLLRFFNLPQPTMKVLLFVALAIAAVVAEPEAEALANPDAEAAADAWHGYYGYGRRWGGYYGGYYGHPYGYGYYRGKRSPAPEAEAEASAVAEPEADADAEAAADAWYGYYGLGHRGYYGYGLGHYGYGYGLGYRGYYGYGYPRAYGYYHHYGKRPADAEPEAKPEADAAADAWYGYYGRPYGYYGYGRRYYGGYYGHKTVIECNILPFFKQPPFGAFETYTTALCNITETVFFMKKLLQNSYLDPIVIKNSQKMPLSKKRDLCNIIRTTLWL